MQNGIYGKMNDNYLKRAYKGKKVLLTGHTGFKGSWMLAWLHQLGAEVMGYALPPKNNKDLYNILEGDNLCKSVLADINDYSSLCSTIISFQPDFIFHLAAQPLVRQSYLNPLETFQTNIIGATNVMESVKNISKQCTVVIITTDKVYENKEWVYPYRETDRLGGYDPYSASKACAEIVVASYRSSFFNINEIEKHKKGLAVARAGNVIGGGDWSVDRIIPDLIRALETDQDVVLRNPLAVRPWQHVLEPICGYLSLGAKLNEEPQKYSDSYNFGPYIEDNLTVLELSKIAIKIWGKGNYITPNLINQPHEAGLLKLDISKALNVLGWRPRYNSYKAIEETVKWYKEKLNKRDITFNQINTYSQML